MAAPAIVVTALACLLSLPVAPVHPVATPVVAVDPAPERPPLAPGPGAAPGPGPLTVEQLIVRAAQRYGLSAATMLRIARCESGLGTNPRAYSWAAPHRGVFQMARRTFEWAAPRAGYAPDWALAFDDAINVDVGAWLMAHPREGGGFGHWSCA